MRKIWIIFLPINFNMCFGCSKAPSHWDGAFEYPKHMFWMRNKENNFPIHTLIWRPEWLHMKCRFQIADVTLKSRSRSNMLKTYIQLIQWTPLSFLERGCSCLPLVCCLFDLIICINVNSFSVRSGRVILGWTSTKQE